jgi:hypothetical membrane protein
MQRRQIRLLAFCGIVMPVIDVLVTVWLAALNPGYSHASQFVSELGEPGRPYAWLFCWWSILYGLLMAGFAFALWGALHEQPGSGRVLAALLAVAAAMFIGAVFPCDAGCAADTLSGQVHIGAGAVSLIATILAPFWTFASMKTSETWRSYRRFTFVTGCLLSGLGVWLTLCSFFGITPELVGVAQRASMLVLYLWIEVLSLRLAAWPGTGD